MENQVKVIAKTAGRTLIFEENVGYVTLTYVVFPISNYHAFIKEEIILIKEKRNVIVRSTAVELGSFKMVNVVDIVLPEQSFSILLSAARNVESVEDLNVLIDVCARIQRAIEEKLDGAVNEIKARLTDIAKNLQST